MLSSDITDYILSFLELLDIHHCLSASLLPASTSLPMPLSMPLCQHLIRKKRQSWAKQLLLHSKPFPPGPCMVATCGLERLAIIDLTGPTHSTHVLSPYCSRCTKRYHVVPWQFETTWV